MPANCYGYGDCERVFILIVWCKPEIGKRVHLEDEVQLITQMATWEQKFGNNIFKKSNVKIFLKRFWQKIMQVEKVIPN